MAKASIFIAEIRRFTKYEDLHIPRVFLTYHFKTRDSSSFSERGRALDLISQKYPQISMIQGRHLRRDYRGPLLARIWFSDHHILFLPSTWEKADGGMKALRENMNGVMIELLYSRMLRRSLGLVVASPVNEQVIEEFVRSIDKYTETKEIPEILSEGWESFVREAKEDLKNLLYSQRRIEYRLDGAEDVSFLQKF